MVRFLPPRLLAGQLLLLLAGAMLLLLLPPDRGAMLLVPLRSTDVGGPIRIAVAHGAAILAAGPVPGSVLVYGDRSRLSGLLRSDAILLLAAPPGACGRFTPRGSR